MQGGHTALAWAAYEGDKKIVNILLNAGAMPDIQNQVQSVCSLVVIVRLFCNTGRTHCTHAGHPAWSKGRREDIIGEES